MKKLFLILALLFPVNIFAYTGYYKAVTIQTGQVPSTQTNFPALLPFIAGDADFKDVAHSGHTVNGNSCYDIRPYSDSGLTTALTFELVTCDLTNGIFEMWVNIPSAADAYVVYVAHGDASFNTDGSSTSTWDSNYKGVYHFPDGTTLGLKDSTASPNNGTNNSATATTGQINGSVAFNGTNQDVTISNTKVASLVSSFTASAWINRTGTYGSGTFRMMFESGIDGTHGWALYMQNTSGTYDYRFLKSGVTVVASSIANTQNTWEFMTWTVDSNSRPHLYKNGSDVYDSSDTFGITAVTTGTNAYIGSDQSSLNTASAFFPGNIDEFHISNTVRSANWIATEYNNQNNLATFWSKGSDTATGGGGGGTCPKTLTLLGVACDFSSLSLGSIPVNFNTSTNFTLSSDPSVGLFNYGPLANPIFRLFQDLGVAAKMDQTIATILNNYKILITDKLGNIIFP